MSSPAGAAQGSRLVDARTPDELRSVFLRCLLAGVYAGMRRLEARVELDDPWVVARERRLGWAWAVANELAGEGAAPERREPFGAAYLATFLAGARSAVSGPWPRLASERSDWRSAYALVLVTLCGRELCPTARARIVRAPGAWDWSVEGVGAAPPAALVQEVERCLGPAAPLTAQGPAWRLALPCDWWPPRSGECS